MITTNIAEVKARLSEFVDRALAGERVVICRHNKPVAELRAVEQARADARPLGPLPGRPAFALPAAFFDPLPDEETALWDGGAALVPPARRQPAAAGRVAEEPLKFGGRAPRPRRRPRS